MIAFLYLLIGLPAGVITYKREPENKKDVVMAVLLWPIMYIAVLFKWLRR